VRYYSFPTTAHGRIEMTPRSLFGLTLVLLVANVELDVPALAENSEQ
jgi:hypothetical protein